MRSILILAGAAAFAAATPASAASLLTAPAHAAPEATVTLAQVTGMPRGQRVAPGGAFRGGGAWRGGGRAWRGGGWRGGPRYGNWRGGWRGGPRYGYYRHRGYYGPGPFVGGLAAGALLGGLLAPPVYAGPPVVAVDPGMEAAIAECARRYRTYDPETQTYYRRPGVLARCP